MESLPSKDPGVAQVGLEKAAKPIKKQSTQHSARQMATNGASTAQAPGVESIIRSASVKYGVDPDYMVRIAMCESRLDPKVVNYNYSENGVDYPSGLFQHLGNYWAGRAEKYGHKGASVFNVKAQAEVTAQMFRDGLSRLWECK